MKLEGGDLAKKKLKKSHWEVRERRKGKGHSGGQPLKNKALYFFVFNGEMNAYIQKWDKGRFQKERRIGGEKGSQCGCRRTK